MPPAGADRDAQAVLEEFWNTREIAGVSLVDMQAWRWLYAHPDASAAEFRQAVVTIAQDVWNQYFAALHGKRDVTLLAIYSHMVNYEMYTPDYALAHLVAFQVRGHFDKVGGPNGAAAASAKSAPSALGSRDAAGGLPAAVREANRRHFGKEFERVARLGALTPDEWMRQAVGAPLSATPLVDATEKAVTQVK
jgi:hypothetical protein